MFSFSGIQLISLQDRGPILFRPDPSWWFLSSPIGHSNAIPLISNIKDEKNVSERPQPSLAQNERSCCLEETDKITNVSSTFKDILDYQVEVKRSMLDESIRSLAAEKNKRKEILKRNREDRDGNKQIVELRAPGDWNTMYQRLIDYKEKYGNCLVPQRCTTEPEIKSLGKWVGNQRAYYKSFKKGKCKKITLQRIEALNKVGFVWSSYEYRWQLMYEELVTYCAERGNCFVPRKYDANRALGIWCKTQREQWHRRKKGLPNTLTCDRIKALNSIGFVLS